MENKNSGVLFEAKKENERQPDYSGNCILDGKPYKMSGWINKSKAGKSYLRVLFNEQQPQDLNVVPGQAAMPLQPQPNQGKDILETDDLPF
jgi:hypothetical protein